MKEYTIRIMVAPLGIIVRKITAPNKIVALDTLYKNCPRIAIVTRIDEDGVMVYHKF